MLLYLLAISLVVSMATAEDCPSQEDMKPCTCLRTVHGQSLNALCKNSNFHEVQKAVERMRGRKFSNFTLDGIKIGRVPSLFFKGAKIHFLIFENCQMTELVDHPSGWAFDGLQTTLWYLHLINSIQGRMKAPPLSHMKDLTELRITQSSIPELSEDWTSGFPNSLKEIWLEDNGLLYLAHKALAKMSNLQKLVLRDQKFISFRRDALPSTANKLRILDLRDGLLESLPADMFVNMPALNYVDISRNPIAQLHYSTWNSVWPQLEWFLASDVPMDCGDSINWMFRLKKPTYHMEGKCATPASRAGKLLKDVIESNLQF